MAEKLKRFSINDVVVDKNSEDKDFAIVELWALSEGNNSHRNPISREVLEKYADSFKGKFIVGKYDKWINDTKGHEVEENIFGYVSVTEDPQFKTKEVDGVDREFVVVKAVLSKIYAKEIVDLFQNNESKSVSCEFSCTLQFDENEYGMPLDENGVQMDCDNPILSYSISGITILGEKIKPAVKGAEIIMKRFSEDTDKIKTTSKEDNMEDIKQFSDQPKDEDIVMAQPNQQEIDDTVAIKGDDKVDTVDGEAKEENVKTESGSEEDVTQTDNKEMSCDDQTEVNSSKQFAAELTDLRWKICEILSAKYYIEDDNGCKYEKYFVDGVFEENGQKFAIVHSREEDDAKRYKVDFNFDENDALVLSDDFTEVKMHFETVGNQDNQNKSFSEQAKEFADESHKNFLEKLFSSEMKDFVEEIIQLKDFMDSRVKADTEKRFSEIMAEPKLCLGEKAYNVLFEEGANLSLAELDGFEAKVKAFCEDSPKKEQKSEDELLMFSCGNTNNDTNIELSVDELIKKYSN